MIFLLACAGKAPTDDTGVLAPIECPAVDLTRVQDWPKDVLPSDHPIDGTQPGVALGDLDGDGWTDAIFGFAGGSLAMRNDGTGALYEEPTFTADGGDWPGAEAVALADVDADGDLDVYVATWGSLDHVYYNDGAGAFTSVELSGPVGAAFSGSFADADGDDDVDLYVGRGTTDMSFEEIQGGNQRGDGDLLYLQEDGAWVDASTRMPDDTRWGITFQGAWLDADADDDLDLYVANDGGPYIEPNHLLLNDGAGNFTEKTDCSCDLEMYSMGAAVGDPDADGLPDLYITDVAGPNLLMNLGGGQFVDATVARGAALEAREDQMTSWGTLFTDFDADMEADLVVTFGQSGANFDAAGTKGEDGEEQPDVILLGAGEGTFVRGDVPSFVDPERTRAVAQADLDGDGRPDLITAGKHFFRRWETSGGCDGRLTVALAAGGQNPDGLGARVAVEAAGRVRYQWMLPGATGSSSVHELYFGLGDETAADRVTVRWPDGTETELTDVPAGRVVVER